MKKSRPNIFRDIYYQPYNDCTRTSLYRSSKASLQMMQRMALLKRLTVHNGCVNSIVWNATGDLILSGSDDQHLVLTCPYTYKVEVMYKTSHRANIFSAKFLPNSGDHRIVSCSGDGTILYTDLMRKVETYGNRFNCHSGTTYEVVTIPGEPHCFLSCGEDGTVRYFDLRIKEKCNTPRCKEDVLISCEKAITALSVNLTSPNQIAIGCSDGTVRIYDRRTLGTAATGLTDTNGTNALSTFTVPEFEGTSHRMTSLTFSPDGQEILASYCSDYIYLFNIKDHGNVQLKKDVTVAKGEAKKQRLRSPLPVRRLRLRGDWSDTGPNARPEREEGRRNRRQIAQARPVLHNSLMQRMTEVLSRMLNDPVTRAALCGGGEDSLEGVALNQENTQNNNENAGENSGERQNEAEGGEAAAAQSNQETGVAEASSSGTRIESNANESAMTEEIAASPETASEAANANEPVNENPVQCNSNVPTDTANDTFQNNMCSAQPSSSRTLDECNDTAETDQSSSDENPCTSMENKAESHMMENLQDRLTKMRDGFLEKHGTEPAARLTYTNKGSTSATISFGMADELIRDNYHAGPSGSHTSGSVSGRSHDKHVRYSDIQKKTDESAFSDSDDDDIEPRERSKSRAEDEMDDETTDEAESSKTTEKCEKSYEADFVKQKYMGHRNARTMIKEANFWGNDFVMSGSDCGHVFIWEKATARLCMLLEADHHVVNCLQPHPYLPLLVTAGTDYDVKLWAPINDESGFDEKFAEDLKKRNAIMLEETRDTMTVPAGFMIRMMACLSHIRRGRGRNRGRSGYEPTEL